MELCSKLLAYLYQLKINAIKFLSLKAIFQKNSKKCTLAKKIMADTTVFDVQKLEKHRKQMLNKPLFRIGMMKELPMAALAGLSITVLEEGRCAVTVPYNFLNKNPFNTTYWAVLGMAAEMAPGAIVLMYARNAKISVSTFVVGCEAKFVKRALGLVTFKTEDGKLIADAVTETCKDFQAKSIKTKSIGYDEQGEIVAEFSFDWGVKARKPK